MILKARGRTRRNRITIFSGEDESSPPLTLVPTSAVCRLARMSLRVSATRLTDLLIPIRPFEFVRT